MTRSIWTDRDVNGNIIQQSVTIGNYSANLTTGDAGYNDNIRYRFSADMLTADLNSAARYNSRVTRDETTCDDGSPCLLVTVLDTFGAAIQNPGEAQAFSGFLRRTWLNLQSGQQVKFESFWVLDNGQERVDFTQRTLLVEKVQTAPQWVLDLLAKVVAP
ncbi:MAG: hypothetical protein QMD04_03155 [Anaerolineales bacterium]|nr:hypothetical protein [Anaerolineales bacterium]